MSKRVRRAAVLLSLAVFVSAPLFGPGPARGESSPEEMVNRIHWQGHASFYAAGSKVVYFDPWEVGPGPKADLVLVSHDHFDHCSPADIARVSTPETIIVTGPLAAQKLSGRVKVVQAGQRLEAAGLTITAVPAYNLDKKFHPRAQKGLGFVVELDGVRIYHAGDTDFIPEMKDLKVDIALLPVSGTYVMDAAEAIQAAKALQPRIAIPMHYGKIVGSASDAQKFAAGLAGQIKVVIKARE